MTESQRIHQELNLEIDELEQRIAPIVHSFLGSILDTGLGASEGAAGGFAASPGGVNAIGPGSTSGIGIPVPLGTPGVGPS